MGDDAGRELLEQYAYGWRYFGGANLIGADLRGAKLSNVDFSGADLSEANLSGANLIDSNLSGANLRRADLSEANLIDSNLSGANFRHADLRNADLSRADLSRADLSNADLQGAKLSVSFATGSDLSGSDSGANLSDANLRGANLSGSDLRGADLRGTNLRRTKLNTAFCDARTQWPKGFTPPKGLFVLEPGADLSGIDLREADLREADLIRANLSVANLIRANLYNASLFDADLSGANLSVANLIRANLSGADLSGANLSGADLSGADLSGADLSGADLKDANLKDANLNGANLLEIANNGPKRLTVTINGTLEQLTVAKLLEIQTELQAKLDEPKLKIRAVRSGSVKIEFDMSEDASRLLKQLFEAGELTSFKGHKVLAIEDCSALEKDTYTTILVLAANPADTVRLAFDREMQAIEESVRGSRFKDSIVLVKQLAVGFEDLQWALLEYQPDIVHFSGHGSAEGVMLVNSAGQSHVMQPELLAAVLCAVRDNVRLAVFNACYSQRQAEAITTHIDCAMGMGPANDDEAAIKFSSAFYRAIGFGRSVQTAFDLGKATYQSVADASGPTMSVRDGVTASKIYFFPPPEKKTRARVASSVEAS